MKIVRRQRVAMPAPGWHACERCGRLLPLSAFARSEKLAGGRHPWCVKCVGGAAYCADARLACKAAYQRSYMRRRRADTATSWLTVAIPGRGRMLARWSAWRREVKITGPFAFAEEAHRILTAAFGVGAGDIAEHGRGAGSGVRRQKTFSSSAPVERAAWERGRDLLVAEGVARVGKGLAG